MEIVFAVAVITTIIYGGAKAIAEDISDLKYAAKGKDHPRWAYRQAKLDAIRRGEPTGYWQLLAARAWKKAFDKHAKATAQPARTDRGPQPLRDYGRRCWADAWKTQEIKHDKRVAARRAKRAGAAGGVEAPVDTELTPQPIDTSDGTDDAEGIPTVVHDHPTDFPFDVEFPSAGGETSNGSFASVDQSPGGVKVQAPVDRTAVPTRSAKVKEREVVKEEAWSPFQKAPKPDLSGIELSRKRARSYLYGEGLDTAHLPPGEGLDIADYKPFPSDIERLRRGNADDRAMADQLETHDPDRDRRWDEAMQRVRETADRLVREATVKAEAELWGSELSPEEKFAGLIDSAERDGLSPKAIDALVYALHEGEERIELNFDDIVDDTSGPIPSAYRASFGGRHVYAAVIGRPGDAALEDDTTRTEQEASTTNDHFDPVPDNVIPFNKPLPTPKEIEPMTTATTEIDGLESAIAWASDVKTNAAEMASGIDDVEGDFAARKVSGETLTLVGQIGEAYDELRELAAQLEEKLQAMQSVAEAYEAAPDTGDKEFVTS
ncbi:hypothetical protein AB0K52_22350 [Glycomyces sp. NPDC049804]|uniref:hypothetical protein n=1 Tax=Glycomyces sp. NPDC049804 TaxID=3154363 RepID=UPI0034395457